MVDGRIYRAFLVMVAFAVIVFGFSLEGQPRPLPATLAPGQDFASVSGVASTLASSYPQRLPGSPADLGMAGAVRTALARDGFRVSTQTFAARTAQGTRTLENVYGSRPGIGTGDVVVIASRDSPGGHPGGDPAGATATASLLALAQALSGESLDRSVTLISTSGQVGAAGAAQLAQALPGSNVDAVLVLGELAGAQRHGSPVVAWSGTDLLSPPALSATLASFVRRQTGIASPAPGIGGQLARLAFPFALTQQAPLISAGLPAVLLSTSGDVEPAGGRGPIDGSRLAGLDTAALQTVNTLDQGPAIPAPSAYLIIGGKLVPLWAVRLLVLALILPVAATVIDALARTRRRGHSILRWVGWVLAGTVPFLAGLIVLLLAGAIGLFSAIPPGAVGSGAVMLTAPDVVVLLVAVGAIVASHLLLRPRCLKAVDALVAGAGMRDRRQPQSPAADAAAVALALVMTVLTLVIWLLNPFSALLLIPALHLWLWLAQPAVRSRRLWTMALALLAFVPIILVLAYYANAYALSPLGLAWSGVLMVTGGAMPAMASLYWALALGCATSALVIAARSARAATAAIDVPISVRGPVSYAGPGSLGGTESALRR